MDDFQNELFDVTDIVQSSVLGSNLMNFKLDKYGVNPCLNEKTTYWALITYWRRGEVQTICKNGSDTIRIGELHQKYKKSFWGSLKGYVRNLLQIE